jgi:hypothetical protein
LGSNQGRRAGKPATGYLSNAVVFYPFEAQRLLQARHAFILRNGTALWSRRVFVRSINRQNYINQFMFIMVIWSVSGDVETEYFNAVKKVYRFVATVIIKPSQFWT